MCGLSEPTIKICLLHEEGHIQEGHCGTILSNLIFRIGGALIISDIIWILVFILSPQSLYFNSEIWIFFSSWGLFLIIFHIRLATYPLQINEYESDQWACEKIRDVCGKEKPSRILSFALIEINGKNKQQNEKTEKSKRGYLNSLKVSCQEYHPSNKDRITNIENNVDK
jgi:Zn-dependent protease with chaperone function